MHQNKIEIVSLCKVYETAGIIVQALQDVNLSIQEGDVYGIIGLSGSGKSTLLRCLASLLRPTSGKILFEGSDLNEFTRFELQQFRQRIGVIFQHFNLLFSRTVAGNIVYPLEIARIARETQNQRLDELLELVGLSSKKHVFPSLLSGGEKQRVAIARALANYPRLLLCDEPTSALDPKSACEALELLKKIHKKFSLTIVLITHDMGAVKQICNKVAVIENGVLIEKGVVSEVFENPQHPTTKRFLEGGVF